MNGEFLATFAGQPPSPTGIDQLLERLAADEFDLIAVGRALLADPEWARKVEKGDVAGLTPFTRGALTSLV